jgi:hypothetical protein
MGDSDRMKNYISDYLENSLDPSTHKEFEDALKRSPELRSMSDRMAILSTRLNNLKYRKCSDDFSLKLRKRIHTSSEPLISRQNMVRYSFAASFVSNPVSGNDANTFVNDGEVNINTKSNQRAISDSTGSKTQPEKKKDKPPIKYVDQKE